jgi:hypothetical protein
MKEILPWTFRAIPKAAVKAAKNIVMVPPDPFEFIREFFRYQTVVEEQQTEREQIKARRDVAVRFIESEREILADYFNRRFTERGTVLNELFGILRQAREAGNDATLDVALRGIVQIVSHNPAAELESFRKARDKGVMLEF